MHKTLYPSEITGIITAPPSKSMTQRAIAAALLSQGTTTLLNPSFCNDSLAALQIAEKLGAEILEGNNEITLSGGFLIRSQHLNCGESGLAMRMFAPIAALHYKSLTFSGEGTLLNRPVQMIGEALTQLGAKFQSNNGFLPFNVQGPVKGGKAIIDGSVSSQLLTGLLMALPLARQNSEIRVTNLKSKPYIDMTIGLLSDFGINIENNEYKSFGIKGLQQYLASEYTIEGDWSGSAFLLVAAAIAGNVKIKGLRTDSKQPDRAVLDVLQQSGAICRYHEDEIVILKSELNAFSFDATECPDLFPPLAALAACCKGTSTITGVNRLLFKESNRAEAIRDEMQKLGIKITIYDNEMHIEGGKVCAGIVNSHNDHRIAMMAAAAAVSAEGPVRIENPECIAKSYPGFFTDLARLGVRMTE
ncbi:MAG: 3-phosphoshikimate 1-carboxyvinyltransferase [Lentimicrobium sp.]|nr:3-phosphoshikimate 1-carboxyvinyltransferase [Lentimicrobium sp.]